MTLSRSKLVLLLSYICIATFSASIITPALPHIEQMFQNREESFERMRAHLLSLPSLSAEPAAERSDQSGPPVDWEMLLPILEPYLEEGALHFLSQTSSFLRNYARSDIFWRRLLRERNFSCETGHYAFLTDFVKRYCRAFSTALCLDLKAHPAFVAKRVIEVRVRELDSNWRQNFPEYFLANTSDRDKALFLLESGFEPTETLFNTCVRAGCSLNTLKPFFQREIKPSKGTIEHAILANLFSLRRWGLDASLPYKKRDFESLMDKGGKVSSNAGLVIVNLHKYAVSLFQEDRIADFSSLIENLDSIWAYLQDKPATFDAHPGQILENIVDLLRLAREMDRLIRENSELISKAKSAYKRGKRLHRTFCLYDWVVPSCVPSY